jgi:hypothetical protein
MLIPDSLILFIKISPLSARMPASTTISLGAITRVIFWRTRSPSTLTHVWVQCLAWITCRSTVCIIRRLRKCRQPVVLWLALLTASLRGSKCYITPLPSASSGIRRSW